MTYILREDAVRAALNGCLVPPDGGSPTEAEVALCEHIAQSLRDLPSAGGWNDAIDAAEAALQPRLAYESKLDKGAPNSHGLLASEIATCMKVIRALKIPAPPFTKEGHE